MSCKVSAQIDARCSNSARARQHAVAPGWLVVTSFAALILSLPLVPGEAIASASAVTGQASMDGRDKSTGFGSSDQHPFSLPPDESFDEATPPALPSGWHSVQEGSGLGWITSASGAASLPNAAFTDDPATVIDKAIEMPSFFVVTAGQLRFRHKMDLDSSPGSDVTFDGVVLEIANPSGQFEDILEAGGSFVSGGYDHIVFPSSGNSLAGRAAWGGVTEGYQDVVVNLPASSDGTSVHLRLRMGTDRFESGVGYWLDDVHVDVKPRPDCILIDGFDGGGNPCA